MHASISRRRQPEPCAPASVSVIVPVWNVEPYLRECLDSVVGQTIGLDRFELIAVDDGSTDGSGPVLDEYAVRFPQVTVIHEPNSGGPGRPRNLGFDHATGTYVFFLDGDDYLGPDALNRLVGMAERNGSAIVLGRMVGVGGRRLQTAAFRRHADRADLERAYLSGSVQKLFRRSLIERVGLRFREGVPLGEDGAFMARLYPEAGTISVVADYDCYHLRLRPGSQARRVHPDHDLAMDIASLEADRMTVVAAYRRPGPGRDILMVKHIEKLVRHFDQRWLSLEPVERRRVFDVAADVLGRWQTALTERVLPPWSAIRAYCLQHGLFAELEDIVARPQREALGDPIVDGGRIFARFPHFRDGSGIPDRCFDITHLVVPVHDLRRGAVVDGSLDVSGEAYLSLVGGTTSVELHRLPRGPTLRFEAAVVPTPTLRDAVVFYREAGFKATIDLSTAREGRPLSVGLWTIALSVGTDRIRRTVPLRAPRITAEVGNRRAAPRTAAVALVIARSRKIRLRVGHPRPAVMWLAHAGAAFERSSRMLVSVLVHTMRVSRPGRLLELAIEELRPDIAARLFDD